MGMKTSLGEEVFFSFDSNSLFAFYLSSLCLASLLFRAVWPQEPGLGKQKKNQGVQVNLHKQFMSILLQSLDTFGLTTSLTSHTEKYIL